MSVRVGILTGSAANNIYQSSIIDSNIKPVGNTLAPITPDNSIVPSVTMPLTSSSYSSYFIIGGIIILGYFIMKGKI